MTATTPVTKDDITKLGIPEKDTTYGKATAAADGLIDVVRAEVLVQDRHHERRVLLDVDAEVAGE